MICAVCETETTATPCTECGNEPLLVGKYRLERTLGRGAQGTTFLATGPDGLCAIKELHLGRAGMGKRAELIHREAAVLEQIDHPNIPSLHEHFVDGVGMARSLYLVQDHVQGENLEERLKTHRFTHVEVTDIVQQTGHILAALHALSPPVIHRDIKPSNLMIDDHGQVHLIDFGSVRDVMRDTVGGGSTVAGTFGYMPPEQLVGDATPQSDVYALGMTAVRLLTRQEPAALTDRTGQLTWRTHANASGAVAEWVDAMVHQDPVERSTAQTVALGPNTPEPNDAAPAALPPQSPHVDVPQAALPPQSAHVDVPQAAPPPAVASRPPTDTARQASRTVAAPITQSGTHVVQFTVPTAFSQRDTEKLAQMAAHRGLLPRNLRVRPVGHSGGLFHLSARADGLPIGNKPWMIVQVLQDKTTVLLQPKAQTLLVILVMMVMSLATIPVLALPFITLDLVRPSDPIAWLAVTLASALLLVGAALFGAALFVGATRKRRIAHLTQDLRDEWGSTTNAAIPSVEERLPNEELYSSKGPTTQTKAHSRGREQP